MVARFLEFMSKARLRHGDKYDYSEVQYANSQVKVKIRCGLHGPFFQTPARHLAGSGCPSCGRLKSVRPRLKCSEFIARSIQIHGTVYDYSSVVYVGFDRKVDIVCPQHGRFQQAPHKHLSGRGCPECSRMRGARKRQDTEFIFLAKRRHGDGLDYSKVEYKGRHRKVELVCPQHGSFWQTPNSHLRGAACPKCRNDRLALERRHTQEQFISNARAVHGEKYDYSKTAYAGEGEKAEIVCLQHGSFWQEATSHLQGHGCPSCINYYSRPHKEIEAFLDSLKVKYESNVRWVIPPKEIDIYVPEYNLAVEFNGTWWHSLTGTDPPGRKRQHLDKFLSCQAKGIQLLQIGEDEWEVPRTRKIWMSVIASKLGKHRRIFARATEFRPIIREQADAFLAENHLQAASPATRWAFGLVYNGTLVGIAAFSKYQKDRLALVRLGFLAGVTVVGGAKKLFDNARKYLPSQPIMTFSDNRYSSGRIYRTLGFRKNPDLPPSYRWLFRGKLRNKRHFRHRFLPKLLGNDYRPGETEHQNMYRNGGRCLYDAGYQSWIYP